MPGVDIPVCRNMPDSNKRPGPGPLISQVTEGHSNLKKSLYQSFVRTSITFDSTQSIGPESAVKVLQVIRTGDPFKFPLSQLQSGIEVEFCNIG